MKTSTSSTSTPTIRHAMTVDVEDYFHVAALAKVISPDQWEQWPSSVERNTQRLLDLFDTANIKATFFVLGWVAERHPQLVREIHARGHEIASHGYSHQLIYKQTPDVFRAETARSKQILEDLAQTPVVGYRAASYSITRQSLWAIDILTELGFKLGLRVFFRFITTCLRHSRYTHQTLFSSHTIQRRNSRVSTNQQPTLFGYRMPSGWRRLFPPVSILAIALAVRQGNREQQQPRHLLFTPLGNR